MAIQDSRQKNIIHFLQPSVLGEAYEFLLINSLRFYAKVSYEYLVGRYFFGNLDTSIMMSNLSKKLGLFFIMSPAANES